MINLDEPLDKQIDGVTPAAPANVEQAPPTAGKSVGEAALAKRLRLPLIGRQPVSFQLQVLATAFLVFLALAGRTATSPLPAPARQNEDEAGPRAVMVVDDSLTVRKITGRLLERAGYRVITAKDGVDALEQLSEVKPALMLADIEMPRMDGFELLRRLRADARFKSLPVIMITSRTADKHRNFALELGASDYLGKPYDEEALLRTIAEYLKNETR